MAELNMEALMAQAMAMQQTQAYGQQAHDNIYRARFSAFDYSQIPQGFSLAQSLSKMGQGGQMLGLLGDVMLPQYLPDWRNIVQRINNASGTNLAQMDQARQYSLALSSMGSQDILRLASATLGPQFGAMASNPAMAQALMIVDQYSDGAISNVARLADPNLMTMRGAQGIMGAQRGLDPMMAVDSPRGQRIKDLIEENARMNASGTPWRGVGDRSTYNFRNDRFTGNFNLDEFANIVGAAGDLHALDYTGLSASMDPKERANRALVKGGSNLAQVLSSLKQNLAPTASTGELANLATSLGMVPGSGADAGTFADIIRKIRALGDAAGMTSDQMIVAGRTLTKQLGGDVVLNTQAAAVASTTMRLAGGGPQYNMAMEAGASRTARDLAEAAGDSGMTRTAIEALMNPQKYPGFMEMLKGPNGGADFMKWYGTKEATYAREAGAILDPMAVAQGERYLRDHIPNYMTEVVPSAIMASKMRDLGKNTRFGTAEGLKDFGPALRKLASGETSHEITDILQRANGIGIQGLTPEEIEKGSNFVGMPLHLWADAAARLDSPLDLMARQANALASNRYMARDVGKQEMNLKMAELLRPGFNVTGTGHFFNMLRDQLGAKGDIVGALSTPGNMVKMLEAGNVLLEGGTHSAMTMMSSASPEWRRSFATAMERFDSAQRAYSQDPNEGTKRALDEAKSAVRGYMSPRVGAKATSSMPGGVLGALAVSGPLGALAALGAASTDALANSPLVDTIRSAITGGGAQTDGTKNTDPNTGRGATISIDLQIHNDKGDDITVSKQTTTQSGPVVDVNVNTAKRN